MGSERERIITKIVACVLLAQGDKVLLRCRKNVDGVHELDSVNGGNEAGSTDGANEVYDISASGELSGYEEALVMAQRITRDSLDVEVELERFKLIHVRHSPEKKELQLFFWARDFAGTPRICQPKEGSGLHWYRLDELPENTMPYLTKVLYYWQRNVPYSDSADR